MDNPDIASLYPPPPPYYRFFTKENVSKYIQLKADGETDESISEMVNLKFLVPPKQPDKEQYRSFGELWWFKDKNVGLKESGIEQIYGDTILKPASDDASKDTEDVNEEEEEEVFSKTRIEELKKMTKSVLLNFLELVGVIAENPEQAAKKIEHIRTILINIHHLLNSYRVHQSRETLILRLQERISQTQDEIDNINETCEMVETKMKDILAHIDGLQLKTKEQEKISPPINPIPN